MSEEKCKKCGHALHFHKGYGKECYVTAGYDEDGEYFFCNCPGFEEAVESNERG